MMTTRMQIIISVLILLFLIVLFLLVRKKYLQPKYTLAWFAVSIGVEVLALFPTLMKQLSNLVGIFSPVNMIFFVGFVYLGFVIFVLSIALSRMSGRVTKLIQEIAILRKEVEDKQFSEDDEETLDK